MLVLVSMKNVIQKKWFYISRAGLLETVELFDFTDEWLNMISDSRVACYTESNLPEGFPKPSVKESV
jgi:hypothetical protein